MVEFIVAMAIFAVLISIVIGVLVTVSLQTRDTLGRARAVDQARLGLQQIDRQVRSGNVISDPASETVANSGVAPYYSLRVYTQTDGVYQCVQWRVRIASGADRGVLEYRSWQPGWETLGGVTAWRVVARDVVAPTVGPISPTNELSWPPFYVDPASVAQASSAAQTIRVTIRVKDPSQSSGSKPSSVTSVLTGRNTVYGYPADKCGSVPAP